MPMDRDKIQIATVHPDYARVQQSWARLRDTYTGGNAVRAGGTKYLPKPSSMSVEEYGGNYLKRTTWYPAVSRTTDGLSGALFAKPPVVKASPKVLEQLADCDLADTPFESLAQDAAREALLMGRAALVVDWSANANRPFVQRFGAEEIVHWRTERVDGDERLVRVVIRQEFLAECEDSSLEKRARFLEYVIVDGKATFVRWEPMAGAELADPTAQRWRAEPPVVLSRRGRPLSFLPLVVFGSRSLGAEVQDSPMLDLADLSLAWYRSSADLAYTLHWLGCPSLVIAGEGAAGGREAEPIVVGPASCIRLKAGATWGTISANESSVAPLRNFLQDAEKRMAALGARMLESAPAVEETATAAAIRHSGDLATLKTLGNAVELALTRTIQLFEWWQGAEADPTAVKASVELNKDLWAVGLSTAEHSTLLNALNSNAISHKTYLSLLQKKNLWREGTTIEQELAEIARERVGTDYGTRPLPNENENREE